MDLVGFIRSNTSALLRLVEESLDEGFSVGTMKATSVMASAK